MKTLSVAALLYTCIQPFTGGIALGLLIDRRGGRLHSPAILRLKSGCSLLFFCPRCDVVGRMVGWLGAVPKLRKDKK